MKAYTYILVCSDGKYYTGSTTDLLKRIEEHELGIAAEFTRKHLPVKLIYYEEFTRIDDAFEREKQVQRWSRKKKKVLIQGSLDNLKKAAECKNDSHYLNFDKKNRSFDRA